MIPSLIKRSAGKAEYLSEELVPEFLLMIVKRDEFYNQTGGEILCSDIVKCKFNEDVTLTFDDGSDDSIGFTPPFNASELYIAASDLDEKDYVQKNNSIDIFTCSILLQKRHHYIGQSKRAWSTKH